MDIHVRIHRWVVWWVLIGVVCGIVAILNILNRNLTRSQEELLLIIGVAHWVLGGIVCYFYDSMTIEKPEQESPHNETQTSEPQKEWHAPSDFLLPGDRKSFLPPRY
jgi:hypothetical protein